SSPAPRRPLDRLRPATGVNAEEIAEGVSPPAPVGRVVPAMLGVPPLMPERSHWQRRLGRGPLARRTRCPVGIARNRPAYGANRLRTRTAWRGASRTATASRAPPVFGGCLAYPKQVTKNAAAPRLRACAVMRRRG